jgi:hypothetical protein
MQIPSLLYGQYADVRKRCRRAITRSLRGQRPFWEAIAADGMIETADHPGLIVVDGPLASDHMHYHCFAPLYLLLTDRTTGALNPAAEDEIFTSGLQNPWSFLCMLSTNAMNTWFAKRDLERYRSYVRAALRHWGLLDAEGLRYSPGFGGGERLWDVASPLAHALANVGVPLELLRRSWPPGGRQPLPPGGLYALLAQADRARAGDLVDIGQANQSSWRSAVSDTGRDERPPASPPPEGIFASEQMSAAMHANDPATVRRLIEAGEPIDASDVGMLRTLLLWAAEHGHTDLVRFLLDHGADIEDRADEGESPLMLAAFGGHRDTVQVLLDRGADPDYVTDKGWDAVMFAELGKRDDVATLIKEAQGHHGPLHEHERNTGT